MRGLTAVDEMTPNVADETLVPGLLNCGVLNALKNSERNSMFAFSRKLPSDVLLIIAISELFWPGPKTMPTPLSPKPVATPSLPTMGQTGAPADLRIIRQLFKLL